MEWINHAKTDDEADDHSSDDERRLADVNIGC
jgi:hypothetical protein